MHLQAAPAMKATLYLLLLLSSSAHAKKGGRPSKPGKPAGFAPRAAVAKQPKASSLETKLLQEHKTNCAVAKQSFAVCADDGPGTYTAGWERFSAPADAVAPGNEPYATRDLLRKSTGPLLSAAECSALTDEMEAHGAAQGWDARYPLAGYTREVKVSDMPKAQELLNRRGRAQAPPTPQALRATANVMPATVRAVAARSKRRCCPRPRRPLGLRRAACGSTRR